MEKKIDYTKHPESDVVVNYIANRFKKGYYTFLLTGGLPGTGKSSVDLRLAELVSKKIHGENRINKDCIIDSNGKLITFVRNSKKGDIGVIEELSVLFPSRRAMSSENVSALKILDTCRKKKVILLSNCPIIKKVDSSIVAMAHIYIETLRINKKQEICLCKPMVLQTNVNSGKVYRHRFRREGREVHRCYFRKPSKDLWDAYEDKKDQFMEELYREEELKNKKKREEKEKLLNSIEEGREVLNPDSIQPLVWDIVTKEGYTKQTQLAKRVGELRGKDLKLSQLNFNITSMRKKGYDIRLYKKNRPPTTI